MVVLSFGQAILLLMDHYRADEAITENLKKIYIKGVETAEDYQKIMDLFHKSGLGSQYEISTDASVINEDSSRRYFETHLAYETLFVSLDQLKLADITAHYNALYSMLSEELRNKFDGYIAGQIVPKNDNFATEYMDAFAKIKTSESYSHFSDTQKDTLVLILKCSWLGVMMAMAKFPALPLNLYGTGFFSEKDRGRITKQGQVAPMSEEFLKRMPYYSNHFGLMKSYMPVPKGDVIFAENGFNFVKPSDQNTFDPTASWPKKNFSTLVNPFSCSISGTTLSQLRCMKSLKENGQMEFDSLEKFSTFLKCFTSSLLFNSGGHVYNEFLAVLKIPEINDNFNFIEGFETIDAITLLWNGNERAFNKAIEDTIDYTKLILAKQECHEQIKESIQLK
ncbi:hypothetical protein [Legionella micdadei]|uniref:Uncharacterized protein n=1 Tax=Legionella micdadei TaxID=451 RepID=A0A098GEH3_LEGMI|nr:hypothetical protein [Legionella micdadei]ARG97981.1 hypothetical protein B6N58_10095 [Legionella micdadei]KTD30222.1 hypothetical protein Lmic_0177 [Legionella micdadei]NSL19236.1 hypothetical protein [Legionella micdadei]CEG60397.1 protein of unknown function [Legionella micdadei]SCY72243.1 hypothetical protein SAMN02982997_02650 [Legionella micdadei]